METRITDQGLCLDEYSQNDHYSDVHYKRAIGELPEMESSKAIANLLAERIETGESILDIGCGAGHYLRSLLRVIQVPFSYTGVDPYEVFLDKAKRAWASQESASFFLGWVHDLPLENKSFDFVMCNNVLTHIPNIIKPLGELIRVCRKQLIIRTPIYGMSYRIQLVYNKTWWQYTDVTPDREFDENGDPRAFSYFDIHSKEYFTSAIKRHAPDAKITYIPDDQFDSEMIESSANTEHSPVATRIVGGHQATGCILLPHNFVVIEF